MKRDHSEGNRDRALGGTPVHPPFQSQAQEIGEDACQKTQRAIAWVLEILAHILWECTPKPPLANAWMWEFWRASPSYLLCLGLMGCLGVPSRARSMLPSECSLSCTG